MTDELDQFLDPREAGADDHADAQVTIVCDLLLFDYDGDLYAVPATSVDSVVAWKAPAPVPGTDARVLGVVQDRGRIVIVMAHPTGEARPPGTGPPSRIVICETPRGHVGVPAKATTAVEPVSLSSEPTPGSTYDSARGPFLYLEPSRYSTT
jgi:chemotaxis signal transduction protein